MLLHFWLVLSRLWNLRFTPIILCTIFPFNPKLYHPPFYIQPFRECNNTTNIMGSESLYRLTWRTLRFKRIFDMINDHRPKSRRRYTYNKDKVIKKITWITLDGKFRIGNYFRHCMITKSCRCRHDDDVSVLNEKWCRLHRFVRPSHQKYCSLSKTGVLKMNNIS